MWSFHLNAPKNIAYTVAEKIDEYLYLHEGFDDLVVTIFEEPKDQFSWIVQGVLSQEPDLGQLKDTVRKLISDQDLEHNDQGEEIEPILQNLTIEKLPEKDWLAENQRQFPPLEIAGFYIYGSHIESPQPQNNIPLQIDASTAFGTGNHGTTHGCLQALQDLKKTGFTPQNPLDIGTGTGILAMGIVSLYDGDCHATDIDDDAVEKAKYNAKLNQLDTKITVLKSDGVAHDTLQKQAPFDLIVANILAGPLTEMAESIKSILDEKGHLVLSGILDHQVDGIKKAYLSDDVHLTQETYLGEWATLIFQKSVS